MKPMRWSTLLIIPNMLCVGLGAICLIKPESLDPVGVGWILIVFASLNLLYFIFRK